MENNDRTDDAGRAQPDVPVDATPADSATGSVRLEKDAPTTETPAGGSWDDAAHAPPPPPPGGPTAPPPGWNTRTLYRSRDPKLIAGVCGGLARATNTDPILFRVILAVLFFVGGLGLAVYLLAWLLLPLEGESASPLEALVGRGQSSTGTVLTIVLGIVAVLAVGNTLGEFSNVLLGAAVLIGLALLLKRPGLVSPYAPAAGAAPPPTRPEPAPAYAGHAAAYPAAAAPPGAYTPPFAPRGPWGAVPPVSPVPPVPPVPPAPRRAPRERSILGRLTLSLIPLAIAVLGAVDLAGASIPAAAYWATALSVTALGLLVGAWYGRARGLIALGIVLALGTSAAGAANHISDDPHWDRQVQWEPASAEQLMPRYETQTGRANLDLTAIDFTNRTDEVAVEMGAGRLQIDVPPNVDVTVRASVGVGGARIFGEQSDGVGITRTVVDQGTDGPGGGSLILHVDLGAGDLEVAR